MGTVYQTPGVYYETVDATSAAISGIRTDIAGFVGIADRGAIDVPIPVESWRQFQARFGTFTGVGYLAYAVRAFFENGGRRCWVVRVASRDAAAGAKAATTTLLQSATVTPVWSIQASSEGVWGNALTVRAVQTSQGQTMADLSTSTPDYTTVASTTGFVRGTLVRLSQQGGAIVIYKVVSDIDPVKRRLLWRQDRADRRLPYDAPLVGIDLNQPLRIESVEFTLLVSEGGIPAEMYEGVSLIPEHPSYGPTLFAPVKPPTDLDAERGIPAAPSRMTIVELRPNYGGDPSVARPAFMDVQPSDIADTSELTLDGGSDGLALLDTYDFTGEDPAPDDSDQMKAMKLRGFRALGLISEVSIVAIPDINIQPELPPQKAPLPPCIPDPCLPHPSTVAAVPKPAAPVELPPIFSDDDIYRVQADLMQHCEERQDRFAVLDPPFNTATDPTLGISAVQAWRTRFDSSYAALYYPWTLVVDPLRGPGQLVRAIPPSGHVVGQYANTDVTVGVHKAPANVSLGWIQDVSATLTAPEHGVLNDAGINVIRALAGRGVRVMGARTMSSDPSWRFVNVRRLILMIMKAVDLSTQWAVFEPNDDTTRSKLSLALITYLGTLWQQGALAGASMQAAFFVKCDSDNNTPDDVSNGRLTVDVGVAPAIPFEFVVLRVWRAGNELEFAETSVTGRRS